MSEAETPPNDGSSQTSELAQILEIVRETREQFANSEARRKSWSCYVQLIIGFALVVAYLPSIVGGGDAIIIGLLSSAMTAASIAHALSLRPAHQRWQLTLYCSVATFLAAAFAGILAYEAEFLFLLAYFCLGCAGVAFPVGLRLNAMISPPDHPIAPRAFSIATLLGFTAVTAVVLGVTMFLVSNGVLNDLFAEAGVLSSVAICSAYGGACGLVTTVAWAFSGRKPAIWSGFVASGMMFILQLIANAAFLALYSVFTSAWPSVATLEVFMYVVVNTSAQTIPLLLAGFLLRGCGHIPAPAPRPSAATSAAIANDDDIFA